MYSYMYIQNIELDQAAIASANCASHYNAGDIRALEAENVFQKFTEQFTIHGELTIKQVEYLVSRQAEWAELVTKAYNDILRQCAAWAPAMIAGSVKCRSNKMKSKAEQELEATGVWNGKMEHFLDNTRKKLEAKAPLDKRIA